MYSIQTASFEQVKIMLDWARQEGWNPGLDDAKNFQLVDPNGFFIGSLDDKPVAAISNVSYGDKLFFLGLYIVHPEYRGQGLGYQIWQHAMNYTGQINCGLDGVVAQQANYMKSGFKLAYRNIRYAIKENLQSAFQSVELVILNNLLLDAVLDYDQRLFPAPRKNWLMAWVLNHTTLVYCKDNQIMGYGVIRRCHVGYKIGPLFANNQQVAEDIFQGLCAKVELGAEIYLDIPEPNLQALKLVENFNMQAVFETARMYTQHAPEVNLDKIFGVTTFELG